MLVPSVSVKDEQIILWVLHRRKCSRLPQEPAVFLEKALQGTATGSTIQPNGNFVDGFSNGWIEHEEQRSRGVLLIDWDQSGVHLANVKVDIGQRVDLVLCEIVSHVSVETKGHGLTGCSAGEELRSGRRGSVCLTCAQFLICSLTHRLLGLFLASARYVAKM